jgi:hypothetical protein
MNYVKKSNLKLCNILNHMTIIKKIKNSKKEKPVETIETVEKPIEPVEKPVKTVEKPVETVEKPIGTVEKPIETIQNFTNKEKGVRKVDTLGGPQNIIFLNYVKKSNLKLCIKKLKTRKRKSQ